MGDIVNLSREPDARNAPVRFDEREEETELRQTGLRRRSESPAISHRETTATAPLLDSTCAVKSAGPLQVQVLPGNWFVPPGSNRSGGGGNKAVGASGVEGRYGDLASM